MTNHSAMEQPRTLVRAIGLTFAGQGGLLLAGTLASILSARLLGPEGKGVVTSAIIAAGVMGLLTELGLRASVIRLVAAGRATWKEGMATMLALYGMLCAVVLPLASLFFWFFHQHFFPGIPLPVLLIALSGVPLGLLEGACTSALIGHQRMPEVSGIWVAEKLAITAGLLLLVWFLRFGVLGAVAAQLFGTVVGIAVAFALLARIPGGKLRLRPELVGGMLRFGSVWYVRNLATSLNYRLDALLVFFFSGPVAAGLYAVAVSMAELLQYLPNSIDSVLFPSVSRGETIPIERRTARLSRFTVFVSLIGAIGLALLGYPLLLLLFGHDFTPGYPALLVLLPGMVVLGQSKVILSELLGRGHAKYPAIASWVGLLCTLALDFLLIPRIGILGAALASTVAYTVSAAVALRYYRATTGIGIRELYSLRRDEITHLISRVRQMTRKAR